MTRPVLWAHALAGLVALAIVARAAAHAARARRGGAGAPAARRRHRRWAGGALVALTIAWASGLTAVLLGGEVLPLASTHGRLGSGLLVLLGVNGLLAPRVPHDPKARAVHAWVGGGAVLGAAIQLFLGLGMLRG